jgi:hypothetical protein
MAHGLDVVAVEVVHVGAVVVLVVLGPHARRAVVAPARGQRSRVERVDRGAVSAREGDVDRRGRLPRPDPEVLVALGPEARGRSLDLQNSRAEGLQRVRVEALARVVVADGQRQVVDERATRRPVQLRAPSDPGS